jgi:ribosomal protein S6--L-glutamate ligase
MLVQNIVVLTRQPDCHAARRLSAAAQQLKLPLTLLDPHQYYLYSLNGTTQVALAGAAVEARELAVIPRLGSLATEYALAALEHLERCGAWCLNGYPQLMRLRHKFSALSQLAAAGLQVPDSAMLRTPNEVGPAVAALGGYPVVLKFIRGSQGVGVVLASDESVARSVLEALNLVQYDVLLQRFYPEAAGSDTRVLVLGGTARWAVQRKSRRGGFRSNFHRGGTAVACELTPEIARLAEEAAQLFNLGLAGVDLIRGPHGLLVLEVNSSPGFETIEHAHGADVAVEILSYVQRSSNLREH